MKNLHHFESNLSGIYLITCLSNNKRYVGSSKSIYYRLRRHLSDLRRGQHPNPILQNCFNKYGEDCIEAQILEQCEGDLIQKEKEWINNLKPEMNINDPEYIIFSDEFREKVSASLKEYYKNNDSASNKSLTAFTLDGKVFKVFKSVAQANLELSTPKGKGVTKALCQKRAYKNFMFRYGEWKEDIEPYVKPERVYKHLDKMLEAIVRGRITLRKNRLDKSRKIKNLNLSIPDSLKTLSRDDYKGYAKPIVQFDLEGNFITIYKSIIEAATTLNVRQDAIEACVRGETMTSNKFIWKPLFQFIN